MKDVRNVLTSLLLISFVLIAGIWTRGGAVLVDRFNRVILCDDCPCGSSSSSSSSGSSSSGSSSSRSSSSSSGFSSSRSSSSSSGSISGTYCTEHDCYIPRALQIEIISGDGDCDCLTGSIINIDYNDEEERWKGSAPAPTCNTAEQFWQFACPNSLGGSGTQYTYNGSWTLVTCTPFEATGTALVGETDGLCSVGSATVRITAR